MASHRLSSGLFFGVFVSFLLAGPQVEAQTSSAPSALPATSPSEAAHPQSAIGGSTQKAKKKNFFEKVGDRISSLDIKARVTVLDLDLADGLKAAIKYRYGVEPSYDGEFHLRFDRATLSADLNVGEILGRSNKYVGLGLDHSTELLYVRPFKGKGDAIKAVPFGYTSVPTSVDEVLSRLPLSAENLINNLAVGEFFSVTARLNIVVGASTLPLQLSNPAFISTHYLISGQFQIHLVKSENQKVEIKLIALRKREKGLSFIAGAEGGLKIVGLRVVDRRIEKWTNLTKMFEIGYSSTKSNLSLVNYVLDMKDPRVRTAYDGIAASLSEIKTMKILNPTQSDAELTEKLISDITPFEAIYELEKSKPAQRRAVDRIFKGKNDVNVSDRSIFKFAPVVVNLSKETEYFENFMTAERPAGGFDYYRLHTFQRTNSNSWWGSYYKGVSISRANMLFDSDKDSGFKTLQDLSFEWNYRDKSLTNRELLSIKGAVKQAVPESIHKTINWGAFTDDLDDLSNVRFIYKMVLTPQALEAAGTANAGGIYYALLEYLKTIPEPAAETQDPHEKDRPKTPFDTLEDKYKVSLLNIAHYLAIVASKDPAITLEQKSNAFAELRFNDLFIEIGPGFLVSVLPPADLKKLVYFEILLTADDVPPMKQFTFGTVKDRKVYEAASYIQSVLTSDEFETITQMMKSARTRK